MYEFWENLIETYSRRHLAHEKDRIPAFAGIVTYIQQLIQDEPLPGLWHRRFAAGLCWQVLKGDRGAKRTIVKGIPSWSWASIVGGISYGVTLMSNKADQPNKVDPLHCFQNQILILLDVRIIIFQNLPSIDI
jgi:hypothetical protein